MVLSRSQKIGGGILGGIVLFGSITLGIRKARKDNFFEPIDTNVPISPPIKASFPLKYGQPANNMLKRLQVWMNKRVIIPSPDAQKNIGISKLKEDGVFGKNTLKAIRFIFKKDEVTKSIFNKIGA